MTNSINQTAGPGCIEKQVQWNHNKYYVWLTFAIHAFEHLRLEHEHILLDLFWSCHKLSSDAIKFQRGKAVKQAEQAFKVAKQQKNKQKNHNKNLFVPWATY